MRTLKGVLRGIAILSIAALTFSLSMNCNGGSSSANKGPKKISIKGSDTMGNLGQFIKEAFVKKNPNVAIEIEMKGSSTGIAGIINGECDFGQSSRDIKESEVKAFEEKFKRSPLEFKVALDALAVYVHKDNPVKQVTMEQLDEIFGENPKSGNKLTNWKQLGGEDKDIEMYGRNSASGTYGYFKEHVLKNGDFSARVGEMPGTSTIVQAISKNPYGIGYGGIGYELETVHTLAIVGKDGSPYLPTKENAVSGNYPMSRYLYWYFPEPPKGVLKDLVAFILSDEGQTIIESDNVGFVKVSKDVLDKQLQMLN